MRGKIIGTFLLLILSITRLYAQLYGQAKIDSLLAEIHGQKEDSNKVKLLDNLSSAYYATNLDEGIKYGLQALELATKLNWKRGLAIANRSLASNYMRRSDYHQALVFYQDALRFFKEVGDKRGVASVIGNIGILYSRQRDNAKALEYSLMALKLDEQAGFKGLAANVSANIGIIYSDIGDYPKAIEYHFKSLKIHEENGDKYNTAKSCCNIGVIYYYQKDNKKALDIFFKALKMSEEVGDTENVAGVTSNIGKIYFNQNDYTKALVYYAKSLSMWERIGSKYAIAHVMTDIGAVYSEQKNYVMAVEYMQKSLKAGEEIGDKQLIAINYCNIAECFLGIVTDTSPKARGMVGSIERTQKAYLPTGLIPTGKAALLRNAINYLNRSLAICKEIKDQANLQVCYNNLVKAYRLNGDYQAALEAAENVAAIKDSVFSNENTLKIAKLEMSMKTQADSLKSEKARIVAYMKFRQQRSYTYIGLAGVVLLLVFSLYIVRNNKLLSKEKKRSDDLLHNMLPVEVAIELKKMGTTTARHYENVTVLFTDFINFTRAGEQMSPQGLIDELHSCFKTFDEITSKYNIEKIKTIGDAYLAVCGLPTPDPKHAENVVSAAIEINAFMADRLAKMGSERTFGVRIGIHTGSVVAGIVGVKKFAYDIWGDTVNTAARMEQNSAAGKINISQTTYELVKDKFSCEYRGEVEAKGKGAMKMYFVH